MFQFRRFPTYAYLIQRTLTEYCSAGFPHSEICGSMLMCSSPQLIAACHVLHRLLMPRHSPCALISLTSSAWISYHSLPRKRESSLTSSRLLSKSKPLRWVSIWFGWFSRIMQASDSVHCSFVVTLFTEFPQISLLPLCCLLAISCLLYCSVFKVHLWSQDQIEMLGRLPKHFDPFLVEVTGLEPVTPC